MAPVRRSKEAQDLPPPHCFLKFFHLEIFCKDLGFLCPFVLCNSRKSSGPCQKLLWRAETKKVFRVKTHPKQASNVYYTSAMYYVSITLHLQGPMKYLFSRVTKEKLNPKKSSKAEHPVVLLAWVISTGPSAQKQSHKKSSYWSHFKVRYII